MGLAYENISASGSNAGKTTAAFASLCTNFVVLCVYSLASLFTVEVEGSNDRS
jgi:hypothetical protein